MIAVYFYFFMYLVLILSFVDKLDIFFYCIHLLCFIINYIKAENYMPLNIIIPYRLKYSNTYAFMT